MEAYYSVDLSGAMGSRHACFQRMRETLAKVEMDVSFMGREMERMCANAPMLAFGTVNGEASTPVDGGDNECAAPDTVARWSAKFAGSKIDAPTHRFQKVLSGLRASGAIVRTVVDVGCNQALVAKMALQLWPDANVFCLEPVHETLKAYCDGTGLQCRETLIGTGEGPSEETLWTNGIVGNQCGSLSEQQANDNSVCFAADQPPRPIKVPVVSLDAFAEAEGIAAEDTKIDVIKVMFSV